VCSLDLAFAVIPTGPDPEYCEGEVEVEESAVSAMRFRRRGPMKLKSLYLVCVAAGLVSAHSSTALAQTSNLRHPVSQAALVWSDEFNGPAQSQPDPANWIYDVGANRWGNQELETYCARASNAAPCSATTPNSYVGGDGYLHIVARAPSSGVYTSARLKTQGLKSFQYGRIEARIKIPEGQGIWPAFWMLGDNITTVDWPACGEIDIMENIGKEPSINHGSLHMTGGDLTEKYALPNGEKLASGFHIYGMIWSPARVQFYIDAPTNIYATFTPADLPNTAHWPFDDGKLFIILNVAVGGKWPGNPDANTTFPQEMLVDYVRVYGQPKDAAR
jgi:beta-glucanase (GH16 family)